MATDKDEGEVKTIDVVLSPTHAALVFAHARGDLDGFKRATEEAIDEIGAGTDDGPDDIMSIMFHTFSWHGEFNFIIIPSKDKSCLIVDLCEHVESEPVASGPMKGRRLEMPRPFSLGSELEDDDDE